MEDIGKRGERAFSGWSAQLATIQKALISMVAVIIAWTVFITIPERLAAAFKDLAVASIAAADEMQRNIIQTAGLLASFATFGSTVGDSFKNAIILSRDLMIQFSRLAAASVASAQDIQLAFQTLVSRGGLQFVKTLDEATNLAGTLTNIIISLTGGLQKERQIVSEISALFEGQARSGAILAKMLTPIVGDLDKWLRKQKELGTLSFELNRIFTGIQEASQSLAVTMSGMIESIRGDMEIINNQVIEVSAGTRIITNFLKLWRDALNLATFEIGRMRGGLDGLSQSSRSILNTMFNFQASIQQILIGVEALLSGLVRSKNQITQTQTISEALLAITIRIRTALTIIGTVVGTIVDHITKLIPMYIKLPLKTMEWLAGVTQISEETAKQIEQDMKYLALMNEMNARVAERVAKMMRISQLAENDQKALEKSLGDIQKIRDEYDKVLVAELTWQKVAVARNQDMVEARKDFEQFPIILKEALDLLERMKQLEIARELRDAMQDISNDMEKFSAGIGGAFAQTITNLTRISEDIFKPTEQDLFPQDIIDRGVELLKLTRNLQQNTNQLEQSFSILASEGLFDYGKALKQVDTQTAKIATLQAEMATAISNAQSAIATGLVPPEMQQQMNEFIDELLQQLDALGVRSNELNALAKQMGTNLDPAAQALIRFSNALHKLAEEFSAMDVIKTGFNALMQSFPQSIAEAAAASIVAGDNFLRALKEQIAKQIQAHGIALIAKGLHSVGTSIWPFNPAGIAAGSKQIAMGAGILALARLVGRGTSVTGTGAGAGSAAAGGGLGEARQVIFQPTANFEAIQELRQAAERLANAAESMEGISPGQVVAMGADKAGPQIARAVGREAGRNPRLRLDLQSVVSGEAG